MNHGLGASEARSPQPFPSEAPGSDEENAVVGDDRLFEVHWLLHRIFPSGHYTDSAGDIVRSRVFKPRQDVDPVFLTGTIDWYAKERFTDRNWRMQLQGWTMFHPIMNFYDDYEDQAEIDRFFLDIASQWWAAHGADPDDSVTTRMPDCYAWYDMSVGFRALILAFFLNRMAASGRVIPDPDRNLLQKLKRKHIANLSAARTFSLNNHGFFQVQGLMALIQTGAVGDYEAEHRYAIKRLEELVDSQYHESGVHLEHSPHYHIYTTSTLSCVLASGWYRSSQHLETRLARAEHATYWLLDPRCRPVCVGDSIMTEQKAFKSGPEGVDRTEAYVTSDFDGSGYAVVRSGWDQAPELASMLFVTGMYHSKAHKHRDCLSFDWYDRGERVLCDSGKYGYRSDKYRQYFLSSKAHNSVEIDGFDILKLGPYGTAIRGIERLTDDVFLIRAGLEFKAIRHERELYFKPGAWLIAKDDLWFARAREFTQWFHLAPEYKLSFAAEGRVVAKGSKGRTVTIDCLASYLRPTFHLGDEQHMNGFISEKDYRFKPGLAVGFAGFGSQDEIATVLALGEREREDGLRFAASRLGSDIDMPPSPVELEESARPAGVTALRAVPSGGQSKTGPWLSGIEHTDFQDEDPRRLAEGRRTYHCREAETEFTFFADGKGSKKLLVMLPGAAKTDGSPPEFQRHSWSEDLPYDVLSIADPTLVPGSNLRIGWFQGRADAFAIDALATLIRRTIDDNGIAEADVMIFGSSAGGFTGLKLAPVFPDAPIVAINPQIELKKYQAAHYNLMIKAAYPGLSSAEAEAHFGDRMKVTIDLEARRRPIFIFQNDHDTKHLRFHLKPFLKRVPEALVTRTQFAIGDGGMGLPDPSRLNVVAYDDADAGHSPPDKATTLAMIEAAVKAAGF